MPITTVTVLEKSSTIPEGEVIRTDPPAGEDIELDENGDAIVTLYVSSGPGEIARVTITQTSRSIYIGLGQPT